MNKKSLQWIPISFFSFLLTSSSHAEISHLDLKGVHDLISPEYQAQVSPVYGATSLWTGSLENRRFFGNYGESNLGIFCSQKSPKVGTVAEQIKKKRDCPLDASSEWIQRLFPSQDGVNFVANQISSDPISHLDPQTIGKILEILSQVKDQDLADPAKSGLLVGNLKEVMFRNVNPKGYSGFLKNQQQEITRQLNRCRKEDKPQLENKMAEIAKIQEVLQALLGESPTGDRSAEDSDARTKGVGKEKEFDDIAKLIVNALKESRSPPHRYPKHLVEHSLLAFFMKKGNSKVDFLSLLSGMPDLLKAEATQVLDKSNPAHAAFLATKHVKEDYRPAEISSDPIQAAYDFAQHPENLAFALMEDRIVGHNGVPPILSYGTAKHSSLGGGVHPDCGETSLRNFFNIVTFHEGQFNSSRLRESAHPNLKKFYQDHSDPAKAKDQRAYDEWSEHVASKHDEVNYLKGSPSHAPQCEINAGLDNMMKVLDPLLFYRAEGGGSIKKASTRAAKLDALCEAVSRDGFHLTWNKEKLQEIDSPDNPNGTGFDVVFSINEKPSFTWQFMGGHFAIQDLTETKRSWQEAVGVELAQIALHPASHPHTAAHTAAHTGDGGPPASARGSSAAGGADRHEARAGKDQLWQLLPWVSSKGVLDHLKGDDLPPHVREDLIYALPLSGNDGRLDAFRQIVSSREALMMGPLAERLRAKLPEKEDLYTRQQIHAALADAGMPYDGEIVHPIGKQDISYMRVSPDVLRKKFGEQAAQAMGRSWRRNLFGHPVVIGEPLRNGAREKYLNFQDAKKACLDLNQPAEKRAEVETAFNERKRALHAFRRKHKEQLQFKIPDALSEIEQQELEGILRTPVLGCYLPDREEWRLLEGDFGFREDSYVPQILPKLQNRTFWSSSRDTPDESASFLFQGNEGYVTTSDTDASTTGLEVRCFCGAAAW